MSALGTLPNLAALPLLGSGSSAAPDAGNGAASTGGGPSWLSGTLAQYVTIGLGLILIIAGLLSFRSVQEGTGFAAKAAIAAA